MCSGTAEGAASGCRADEDDIREDEVSGRFGGIATRKRRVVLPSNGAEACKEVLNPSLSAAGAQDFGGKGEREEGAKGCGAHGGEVAEATRKTAMADRGWRVKVAAKVPVFEAEVGGDEDLVSGGRTKDGTVISDTEGHCLAACSA